MITVYYFAAVRQAVGMSEERVELPGDVRTVAALREHLAARAEPWPALRSVKSLRAAVNLSMVPMTAPVRDGDEVAFFPPVTGG